MSECSRSSSTKSFGECGVLRISGLRGAPWCWRTSNCVYAGKTCHCRLPQGAKFYLISMLFIAGVACKKVLSQFIYLSIDVRVTEGRWSGSKWSWCCDIWHKPRFSPSVRLWLASRMTVAQIWTAWYSSLFDFAQVFHRFKVRSCWCNYSKWRGIWNAGLILSLVLRKEMSIDQYILLHPSVGRFWTPSVLLSSVITICLWRSPQWENYSKHSSTGRSTER